MYLHIGKNTILKKESIIGAFKVATIENTEEYKKMEQNLKENKKWVDNEKQEKNTFILTEDKGYITNISVATLEKRAKLNII